jgi:hypothetical protein
MWYVHSYLQKCGMYVIYVHKYQVINIANINYNKVKALYLYKNTMSDNGCWNTVSHLLLKISARDLGVLRGRKYKWWVDRPTHSFINLNLSVKFQTVLHISDEVFTFLSVQEWLPFIFLKSLRQLWIFQP